MSLFFRAFIRPFIELIFPKLCWGCKKELSLHSNGPCLACEFSLPYIYFKGDYLLDISSELIPPLELKKVFALYYFYEGGRIEKMLYETKYQGIQTISIYFGKKLAAHILQQKWSFDGIIGVPLHKKRKRKRGYNQVDLIGQTAANLLSIPYFGTLIERIKNTPMLSLIKGNRVHIVKDAFRLNRKVTLKQGHYLLIDDIFTTGATLKACAMTMDNLSGLELSIATICCRS